MKNERINKKRYKIITYFCVFLLVVVAGVGLALGKTQNKVKAGVIIDNTFELAGDSIKVYESNPYYYFGLRLVNLASQGSSGQACFYITDQNDNTIGRISARQFNYEFMSCQLRFDSAGYTIPGTTTQLVGGYINVDFQIIYPENTTIYDHDFIAFNMETMFQGIRDISNNNTLLEQNNISLQTGTYLSITPRLLFIKQNKISSVNNIFDLPNNALTLLYINDVSGLSTSELRDEITINWGYINSNDNTIYAEHAPTISAQNMQTNDKIIRLGIPLNAAGDAMNYYNISQQALLNISSLPNGSATAQAHIYGVYVWHNSNNIKWGIAEFNTQVDPLPGSALNMNYITSLTELYDYQNTNTGNMTCRLSVSSNFNFITIKNQTNGPDKDSINAVIQQGGFLPAWSVYNWARGTYSGFIAGDASARADYLEGQPGYEAIYQAGFSDGFNNAELGTANWFITSFRAVDAFLSIHIFPNITFGVLLGIPFVISVAWFIIRMFRGGGGE